MIYSHAIEKSAEACDPQTPINDQLGAAQWRCWKYGKPYLLLNLYEETLTYIFFVIISQTRDVTGQITLFIVKDKVPFGHMSQ